MPKACRVMSHSRQKFYEIRCNYQTYGAEGHLDWLPCAKGPNPNRVNEATEKAILERSLEHHTHDCLRVAQELALKGIGRVYLQSVIGCHSRYARGRPYITKLSFTALHVLR